MPTLNIGKTGIERILNENLVGVSGKKEIEINAYGREIREISKQQSKKGIDVNISVDLRVQKFAHQEISKYNQENYYYFLRYN